MAPVMLYVECTYEHAGNLDAGADRESAAAFGGADLVTDEGEEVHVEVAHIDGDLPEGLRGIRMHQGAVGVGDRAHLAHALQAPGLRVCMCVWGLGCRRCAYG